MNEFDPLNFKFRWMDEGTVTGYVALAGSFDGKTLTLGDETYSVSSIAGVVTHENVLCVVLDENEYQQINVVVSGETADTVKRAIDASRSGLLAAEEQKQLNEQGQGASFRSQVCPYCNATISLSKFADTPQCYCEYCMTLFTIRGQYGSQNITANALDENLEQKYRMCDECGMYAYPRQFTIFYFIFLVYFLHWISNKTVRCPACMRFEAWKMLFGNIFGLLGLPVAFIQLFRSYRGKIEKGPLKGLDDANILANRGKIDRALDRYDVLMDNLPINAGIKYNIGSGLLTKGDVPHAETMFLLSLEDCANFAPSLSGLHFCYNALDKKEALQQLKFQMGIEAINELEQFGDEMWDDDVQV